MQVCFLDSNVLLRYLTQDDKHRAQRALNLLTRIERGEQRAITSSLVIFETVFTLQRSYDVPRQRIMELVLPVISLRGLHLPGKSVYHRAFELYITKNISFVDAYNVAYMLSEEVLNIYSWDVDFDKIEGICRLEPEEE